MRTPFFGGYDIGRSKNLVDNQLINLYGELVQTKQGREIGAFYMCPGLDLIATVGPGPIRGMQPMSGSLYVVSGPSLYRVSPGFEAVNIGPLNSNGGPVSIINNGTQLAVFDAVGGYLATASSFSDITLPFTGAGVASYQDGFGLLTQPGTNVFWQSNALDLSTWDPLTFSSADGNPSNIISIAEVQREQWIFKQDAIEIWVDAGLQGFAFQRLDGIFIEVGCCAAYSVARAGDQLLWLTQNGQGLAQVAVSSGYQHRIISTNSIEREFSKYATVSDAIGYAYQQEGHLFYVLTFPTGNATWVLDLTTTAELGVPVWHRRAAFSSGAFSRHWGNCYTLFNGQRLVGDYRNGNIYAFDLNTQTDNGSLRKWVRSWRALPKTSMDPVRFTSLQIDMQTGMGVPSGTNPQCVLRWSDDGGHNYSPELFGSAGKIGETARRVKFNRLGSTKRGEGLDRVFELSSTDAFDVALIGAELL